MRKFPLFPAVLVMTIALSACGSDDRPVDGPALTEADGAGTLDGELNDGGTTQDDDVSLQDTGAAEDTAVEDTGAEDDTWIWQDTAVEPDTSPAPFNPVALTIIPPQATLPVGAQITLNVTAKLDDGSSVPATGLVGWESDTPGVVQITAAGVASALSAGTATITARYDTIIATATITVTPLAITSLTLTPTEAAVGIGATQSYSAIATLEGGASKDITAGSTWTVDNPSVAEVTAAGQVLAKASGTTTVRASAGGKEGTAKLTVKAASVTALSLSPASATLAVGETVKMTLSATYSDGSVADVTSAATWSSSAAAVAKVDAQGVVTASSPGGANISATFGALTTSRPITVVAKPKKLTSVTVSPDSESVVVGDSLKLSAQGVYDDGSKADLTTTVVWTTSANTIATVSNAPATAGTVSTIAAGLVTVTATYEGQTGEAKITVTDAKLTKLKITTASGTVPAGLTSQFKAIGTFSDGKELEVTKQAIWSAQPAGVVTVENGSNAGLVKGIKAGKATVTATLDGISDAVEVNVSSAILLTVLVTPKAPSVEVGGSTALKATGVYSDQSEEDVTASVAWTVADDKVATIDNSKGKQGTVNGVAPGTTDVTAALGTVSGKAKLTVKAPSLKQVIVGPASPIVKAGQTVQLWAVAEFSNGAQVNITQQAKWTLNNPAVASVTTSGPNIGLALAKAPGKVTVAASFGGKSGEVTVTVTSPELLSLQVTPAAWSVASGVPAQFQAVALFSDNSTQNVTWQANWSVDKPQLASIGNKGPGPGGPPNKGRVTTKQPGTIKVTAAFQGLKADATLTITSAKATELILFPGQHTCYPGQFRNFQATLLFSDGSSQQATQPATWGSSDNKVASSLNGWGQKGIVQCLSAGTTKISATVGGYTASANLTVSAAKVKYIALQPLKSKVAVGSPVKFNASAVFDDGTTDNITWQTTFASSDPTIASISNGGGFAGWTQTLKPGKVTITATWQGFKATGEVEVTAAEVKSIEISPTQPTVGPGTYIKLNAVAVMTDNTTQNISWMASWSSDKPAIATVFNGAQGNPQANQNKGMVQALSPGVATITVGWGGKTGSTTVTVQQAAIKEIQVTPFAPILPIGYVTPLQATALFTDLSTQNLTGQVSWVSSDPSVVTVDTIGFTKGWATPLKKGKATITATANGVTGSTEITVTDAKLQSIEIKSGVKEIQIQQTVPLKALGKFSGGLQLDITAYATWLSSDAKIAGISNAWGSWGQIKGLQAGDVTASAVRDGVEGKLPLKVKK